VILVYPAIAPSRPRRALAAGLIAASMDGLGILVAELLGFNNNTWTREFAGNVVWSMVPNYVCAVLALLPASLIRRLGREAGAARELGSYRLGRLVQRGGMGEVYEATHRLIAKPAAIKLIRPELLSDSPAVAQVIVQRFYHEAEAVAALRSPHTVALYDFGVAADGTLYYVMELLEGIDLQRLVRDYGPLPPARAVHIIRQACDSLGEAHGRGIIHRDIKPSNVFLCQLGLTADFAKVLDFGLVRREVQQDAGVSAVLGQPGTPSYMAPEMITGTAPVDRRADVYALGCVTYWLLTGKTVFEADNPVQMMYRHAYDPPPSPSERLGSSLPPDLEALVLATLAKDPLGRPQTAEELARRLEECDTGPGWTGQQAREWWAGNLAEVRNSRS
jgi:serine/threonine-protein kinase